MLVSAFLAANGAADAVIHRARDCLVFVYASDAILDETRKVLAYPRLVERYQYTAAEVEAFCARIRAAVLLISPLPSFPAICRDPHDDMVLACARAAGVAALICSDRREGCRRHEWRHQALAMLPPKAHPEGSTNSAAL